MKTRRRRWFRDETLAPWLTLMVILGLWWGASSLLPSASDAPAPSVPATDAAGDRQPGAVVRAGRVPPAPAEELPDRRTSTDDVFASAADAARAVIDAPTGKPIVPVVGIEADSLKSMFDEARGGGSRRHEALDILAPRGTTVVASVDGRIAKLFTSKAGGLTIYQFDPEERYCYYYAHLDSYAPDLTEGQIVRRGQVIGFVGTTGNAPPGTPHLHFAIYRLGPDKKWWEGEPLDPVDFLR